MPEPLAHGKSCERRDQQIGRYRQIRRAAVAHGDIHDKDRHTARGDQKSERLHKRIAVDAQARQIHGQRRGPRGGQPTHQPGDDCADCLKQAHPVTGDRGHHVAPAKVAKDQHKYAEHAAQEPVGRRLAGPHGGCHAQGEYHGIAPVPPDTARQVWPSPELPHIAQEHRHDDQRHRRACIQLQRQQSQRHSGHAQADEPFDRPGQQQHNRRKRNQGQVRHKRAQITSSVRSSLSP